jgi:His/Glu/Gln/Arg/opine family amino acid ABC transporter permease subunit
LAFPRRGVLVTLALAGLSGVTSVAAGFVVALLRMYGPRWLRPAVVFYIDSMRAIPVLVVLVWAFFALPIVGGITLPPFWAALLGLTLHLAAYAAEIVRAGVESVRPGQTRAALALGMSRAQILRRVVMPQATVRMLPAFGSLLSITIKDTAIASVIACRAHAPIGDRCGPELPADRGVHVRDGRVLRDPVPGDARRGSRLSPRRALGPIMTLDWSVVWQHREALLLGTARTFLLTVATMAIALPCGIVVAALRLYAPAPVRASRTGYVELFRNLPLILVVFWAFYVVPIMLGVGLSPLATGLAALALNVTAYNAETFRAGINSIRRGQTEAAVALGMSRVQALRRVVIRRRGGASCRFSRARGFRCSRTRRSCR